MTRWGITLLAAMLLSFTVITGNGEVQGAEKVTFELKLTPGSKKRLQRENSTTQNLKIGEGNVETKSSSFAVVERNSGDRAADGSLTVVEKHEVLQASVDIAGTTYEFDSANPDTQPGEAGLRPLADLFRTTFATPVNIVYEQDGTLKEVAIPAAARADLDPNYTELFDPEQLKKAVSQERSLMPQKAVGLGDKWEGTREMRLGGGQVLTFKYALEYLGTIDENGATLHRVAAKPVEVTYFMDPGSPSPLKVTQSDLKVKNSSGEYVFDVERGTIVRESSQVEVTGTLTFVAGGNQIPGAIELEMSSKSQLQPTAE